MHITRSILFVALAGLAQASLGANEKSYDFVACGHAKRTIVEMNHQFVGYGLESWGVVANSTTKDWENASSHCTGYMRVFGGKTSGGGICQWTIPGGDTAVGEFDLGPTGEARWTWLSGTGRLMGIQGSGTLKEISSASVSDPATTWQGCRRETGKYAIVS
jgi:hypothetical protein